MFSETEKKIILETKEIIKEKVSKEVLFEKEYFSEMKLYDAVLNKTKIYLSGGAISSIIQSFYFLGTTPKDWDLYFSDTLYRDLLVKRTNEKFYHLVKIEENHYSDDDNAKNPNAINLLEGNKGSNKVLVTFLKNKISASTQIIFSLSVVSMACKNEKPFFAKRLVLLLVVLLQNSSCNVLQ
jgi:hypothetical protein